MAASFILLLLPILRRRRRNKPDSLPIVGLCKRGWCASTPPSCWSKEDGLFESDLALEFFYVRFAQLVVLSCTQREEREREREKSLASAGRARGSTRKEFKNTLSKEKDDIIIIIIIIRKKENARNTTHERTNRRRARQRNSSSSFNLPNHLQPLPPLVGLPVSPQRAKDVD